MNSEPLATTQTRHATDDAVLRVLSGLVKQDPATITDETRIFLGLGLTSVRALELIMLLEDELQVDLQGAAMDWRHLETVGSLRAHVADRAGIQPPRRPGN
jgi:acyl carrier protein